MARKCQGFPADSWACMALTLAGEPVPALPALPGRVVHCRDDEVSAADEREARQADMREAADRMQRDFTRTLADVRRGTVDAAVRANRAMQR